MSQFVAFWIAVAVFVACDYCVFRSGADSFFWQYKTPQELELQKRIIGTAAQSLAGNRKEGV